MTKPMLTSSIKTKNSKLERVQSTTRNSRFGHLLVVDIFYDHKNVTQK